jgi:GAF domain-containing protein/ribosomal protein L37E
VAKQVASETKKKPVLDEQALGKLLEAAYVLQQHNREMQELELGLELKRDEVEAQNREQDREDDREHTKHRAASASAAESASESAKTASADYTVTLAQIVETQRHIQIRHLDLQPALELVVERVLEIAHGCGAAIGIADGKIVRYKAAAGEKTPPTNADVSIENSLSRPCLRTSQVFRCADINPEFLIDTEECRRRGIQSLIAVPIFHGEGVAGGLELYYASTHAFTDQDVHTCQLMAGLVTEALAREQAREEDAAREKNIADERAAMLEALEKLGPNLAALVNQTAAAETGPKTPSSFATAASSAAPAACRRCGHEVASTEQFCGRCGLSRTAAYEPPSMQTKLASLWQMQEEKEKGKKKETTQGGDAEKFPAESTKEAGPIQAAAQKESAPARADAALAPADHISEQDAEHARDESSSDAVPATITHPPDWSSAASARDFLEHVAPETRAATLLRFWNTRRGDIYLAIAVLLVACVIRWGIWSSPSANATATPNAVAAHQKPDPEAGLSFFDRLLISLGLADPPEVPEDKGNPTTQVWVDLHTALYYCPGADLYGKTPTGKFTTQREAQLDQFEPAYRKTCN